MDNADALALICSLAGLAGREISALERAGWTMTRLATLRGCDEATLRAVVWQAAP